jgi:hypothetical protein
MATDRKPQLHSAGKVSPVRSLKMKFDADSKNEVRRRRGSKMAILAEIEGCLQRTEWFTKKNKPRRGFRNLLVVLELSRNSAFA